MAWYSPALNKWMVPAGMDLSICLAAVFSLSAVMRLGSVGLWRANMCGGLKINIKVIVDQNKYNVLLFNILFSFFIFKISERRSEMNITAKGAVVYT